jgi:hypothetical protein
MSKPIDLDDFLTVNNVTAADADDYEEADSHEEERREQLSGRMADSGLRDWNTNNRI